ncbi:hypothetical protein ACWDYJ_22010 [Streptomyces sp. NPDC003042]
MPPRRDTVRRFGQRPDGDRGGTVAGESPDKSVDEGASGAAESSTAAEQDPRLSVFQPRDPLKEAVAAWVATAEASPGREDQPPAAPPGVIRQSPPPAEPDSAAADAKPAATEPRTTAFGVVKPASASGEAEKPSTAPSKPSGDKPSADPRAAKPDSASAAPAKLAGDKPGSADAEKVAEGESGSGAADGERTAVFRAVKSDSASADAKPAAVESRTTAFGVVKPGSVSGEAPVKPSGGKPGSADAEKVAEGESGSGAADSERTAVFRAVKPGSASADAKPAAVESRMTAFGVVKPGFAAADAKPSADPRAAKPDSAVAEGQKPQTAPAKPSGGKTGSADAEKVAEGESGSGAADGERTAVFRAVKSDSASADAKPAAVESRTTAFGVVKPGSAAADPRAAKPDSAVAEGQKPQTAPAKPSGGKPGSADAEEVSEGEAGSGAADSERTAVFRAVKSGSASVDGKPAAVESRTTAFGVVKPGVASGEGQKPPTAPAPGAPGAEKSYAGPRTGKPSEGSDSERTAVFRAVKPGSAPADAKPAAPSAAGEARTVKPGSAPAGSASTFVPLPGPGRGLGGIHPGERTTQQPLPPKPPLDMLADLTNNPPPPPSPLRTAIRRVKIYAPVVLLLAVVLAVVQLVRPLPAPRLVLTAQSTYTFPGGQPDLPWPAEGQAAMAAAGLGSLGRSGEQKPVPIASVTKSMTAYIILRDHPLKKGEKGPMIDIDKTAETEGQKDKSDNESTLNTVKEGDKISEYDAVAALMIPSANNIARLLARWDSGSQEAFVKKMNDTAKELGMTNTTYTDPSGLDATTVSTAEDQVKLGLKIVEIESLVDITRKPSWVDPSGKTWSNWNRLVPYNDSLGIKTGTTTKAGGNLLFAAQKKVGNTNQLIVGAVLGQHKPPIIDSVIAASRTLLVATQKAIEGATVVKKGAVVGYVDDGVGGRTPVVATADVQAVGWSSLTVNLKLGDGGAKLPETAKAGTEVGVLTVGEGASQVKVPVALRSELLSPGIGSKLTRIG